MREIDSAYDRRVGQASDALWHALSACHDLRSIVSGAVLVDGQEIDAEAWDHACMAWDGSPDGLRDLGWDAAADAAEEAEEPEVEGFTFEGWLRAASRKDSASCYDLRAAWRAGENPEEYTP